ncbi:hypothetical protein ACFQLX_01305 [Streptomyces polyrhachis]|uniref:Uncharacterized protein n=1 Tax=Streptomyces polyrhachis TaxID=1282885 RepID=A0ABW2G7S0_9ACTN
MTELPLQLGLRFFLVHVVPMAAAVAFVLVLAGAGAPGDHLVFADAWRGAGDLSLGTIVLLGLAVLLAALALQPLQLGLVRLYEGYWPGLLRGPARVLARWQRRCRDAVAARVTRALTARDAQAAGEAGEVLRWSFPARRDVLATRLGNALAAMEEQAGAPYGWDAAVAWPRLYSVLGDACRQQVDGQRNALDTGVRLTAVATLLTPVALWLLWGSGWWLLLALAPPTLARLSYRGAVHAALGYGQAVTAAFDLHRFDLLTALHLPPPPDREAERTQAADLCTMWRQGAPTPLRYDHTL